MKAKKPTQKKKSAPLWQLTKLETEGLPVFDTVNGKIVGRVIEETGTAILLECAGLVLFSMKPVNGGESFKIEATIQNPTFVGRRYALAKAAIRGLAMHAEPWLTELWSKYAANVISDAYSLNPVKQSIEVQQGDGVTTGETETIAVESAVPPPVTPAPEESGRVADAG